MSAAPVLHTYLDFEKPILELEKKIADLKAVEGWLKMNLNLLQLHIQGLEMQCTTLAAMQNPGPVDPAMGNNPANNLFTNPALWPWNVLQQAAAAAAAASEPTPDDEKKQA